MKYEFIKIDDDVTELRYKDKVFKIKNTECQRQYPVDTHEW